MLWEWVQMGIFLLSLITLVTQIYLCYILDTATEEGTPWCKSQFLKMQDCSGFLQIGSHIRIVTRWLDWLCKLCMYVVEKQSLLIHLQGITTNVHRISVNRNQLFFAVEITAFLIQYQLIIKIVISLSWRRSITAYCIYPY